MHPPKHIRLSARSSSFRLQLSRQRGVPDDRMSKEPLARLLLVHGGQGEIVSGRKKLALSLGSIVLANPAAPYQLVCDESFDWSLIRFDAAQCRIRKWDIAQTAEFHRVFAGVDYESSRKRPLLVSVLPRHFDQATALAGEMGRELSERLPGWSDLALGHFQHLVIVLCRHAGLANRLSNDASYRAAPAIRRIESCYGEDIDFRCLAQLCAMSDRTFYRVFKQATGQTVQSYVKRIRLDHAAEALRMSDGTITEIAMGTGFQDSNYFARAFRKSFGFSPTQYRRRWQE